MSDEWKTKIKNFWQKYEFKIVLCVGLILISIISFSGGYLKGKSAESSPLIIEKVSAENENTSQVASGAGNNQNVQNVQSNTVNSAQNDKKECAFVASKNSKIFHISTCTWAKRIKPENLICFSSMEEAIASGRQPDKACIK